MKKNKLLQVQRGIRVKGILGDIQGLYNFEALPPTPQTTSILPVELEIRNLLQPLQKEHEIQTWRLRTNILPLTGWFSRSSS